MADDAAARARRYRAHRRGDHSLCDPERRCDVTAPAVTRDVSALSVTPPVPPEPGERSPGGMETAVQAFVDALPHPSGDPRAILGQIAVQLARRVDEAGALPAAVKELRILLMQLAETPNASAGTVDEIRLRRAQRRLDALLAQVA